MNYKDRWNKISVRLQNDPVFAKEYREKRRQQQLVSTRRCRERRLAQGLSAVKPKKLKLVVDNALIEMPIAHVVAKKKAFAPIAPKKHMGNPWSGLTLDQLVAKGYAKMDAVAPIVESEDDSLIAIN
jgi:hypothetical protein